MPFLKLFFTMNGIIQTVVDFIINKFYSIILTRKAMI